LHAIASAEFQSKVIQEINPLSTVEHLFFDPKSLSFSINTETDDLRDAIGSRPRRSFRIKNQSQPQNYHTQEGTTLLLLDIPEFKNNVYHYFHLYEHLIGLYFHHIEEANDVKKIILANDGTKLDKTWEGPNNINQHLLKALYPNAEVWTWANLIRSKEAFHFPKVIISDRQRKSTSYKSNKEAILYGETRENIEPSKIKTFHNAVRDYVKYKEEKNDLLVVTFILRYPPRTLKYITEITLINEIHKLPGIELNLARMENMSFHDQVKLMSKTDFLLSVHGNGLTNIMYMNPGGTAIEIFQDNFYCQSYRTLSEIVGVDYFAIQSNGYPLDSELAYEIGLAGSVHAPISYTNIGPLLALINERIKDKTLSSELHEHGTVYHGKVRKRKAKKRGI